MIRLATVALLLATTAGLAAPVPKEVRKCDSLNGVWEVTSIEIFGRPGAIPMKQRWKIENNAITVEQSVPNAAARFLPPIAIKVNGAAKPPSLDYNTGAAMPRAAIYEVDGDTLKIMMNMRGAERPKDMKPDDSSVLYVFKRVKE